MHLYATPLSHFSRKIRLLLDHLKLQYDFIDVGNVADQQLSQFHGNPLLSVPVLLDGDRWIIESDHIAEYVVRNYDPDDRFEVLASDWQQLNVRAVMNGIMANETKLILSKRTGLDPSGHAYFEKARAVIKNSLAWIGENADVFNAEQPKYLEFHFISMWDHLNHYGLVNMEHASLASIAEALTSIDVVQKSAPAALRTGDETPLN